MELKNGAEPKPVSGKRKASQRVKNVRKRWSIGFFMACVQY